MSGPRILALDTATRMSIVVVGDQAGVAATDAREARHRHGSLLLEQVDAVLAAAGRSLEDLEAIAVGTGPGSFTGMRVGLATAKTIAHVRGLPLVGVPSAAALRDAAVRAGAVTGGALVVLPAGAHDHYLVDAEGGAALVAPGSLETSIEGREVVAVDIGADAVGEPAAAAGRIAVDGLGAALLARAMARVAADDTDAIETLVPVYVSLPRGVRRGAEELGWSPDLR